MMSEQFPGDSIANLNYENERIDLACAFRWTVRMGMHEAIANHFSLAVNADGTRFLINPKNISVALKPVICCCWTAMTLLISKILMLLI
jgi:hypothetical protein